jgi:hypothetical protein
VREWGSSISHSKVGRREKRGKEEEGKEGKRETRGKREEREGGEEER